MASENGDSNPNRVFKSQRGNAVAVAVDVNVDVDGGSVEVIVVMVAVLEARAVPTEGDDDNTIQENAIKDKKVVYFVKPLIKSISAMVVFRSLVVCVVDLLSTIDRE
jgi:hypothetical protein